MIPILSKITLRALLPALLTVAWTIPSLNVAKGQNAGLAASAESPSGPPRIIETVPKVGQTEVDPALKEITVTFDRDMAGGFSWTGGGPEYPPTPQNQKPHWKDKRTCVLPVTLQAARYYRVGINSKSFQNFRSADGMPANPSAIYFATKGASDQIKRQVARPQIRSLTPINGAKDVDPSLSELRVGFNMEMAEGCSWCGSGLQFPTIPDGKKPFWTDGNKTCVLPVTLRPGTTYYIGLNCPSAKNFQSAGGVPLDPVSYTFRTRD